MLWFLVASLCVGHVWGHAALHEPPGRSSMWRFGFPTPRNNNDNELFCGGVTRLWRANKGKCGICGDDWALKEPRPNEDGGKYGNKIITRTYKSGQEITTRVSVTANHLGFFEFKVCPVQEGVKTDQACLDKYPLELADGSGTRFNLGSRRGMVEVKVKLPPGLTCERCVFQWHYKAANNWGICEDGKGKKGCGPQEYFRGCSDIKIE